MMNGGAKYQEPIVVEKKINIVVVDEQNRPVPDALVKITINDAVVASATTSTKGECSNIAEVDLTGYTLINIEVDAYGYKHKIVKQIRVAKDNQTYRVKLDEEVIFMGKMKADVELYIEPIKEVVTCNSEPVSSINHPILVLINPFPEKLQTQELDIFHKEDSLETTEFVPQFEFEKNVLSFISYPNPTTADITIQTKEDVSFDVKIFNESGALVLQQINQYQRAQISLEGNAAGNYFAMIFINNKAVETHKIVLIK